MARIVLDKVSKIFKGPKGEEVRAVNNVSLTIEDREFLVLVGPSGCGKSTTLRMMAGLEEVSCGTISIAGKVVNDVEPQDRDLAMVFQNYALYPHMTVYENMAFGLKLRRYPRAEIDLRVSQAAEILGITPLLDRLPRALSGGQRQRVAVGRAIVRQPKAFLFDEPLSNLDAQMRVQMRVEISRLHQRLAATIVYVTHDQVEAMTMGDRIAVLKNGEVQQIAGPLELYRRPANLFVAGFIGAPPMNFFRGVLSGDSDGLRFCGDGAPAGIKVKLLPEQAAHLGSRVDKPIILGLRPEDVRLATDSPRTANGSVVEAVVELIEPLGAETHFHLKTGPHGFICRMPAAEPGKPGQKMFVVFDLTNCHFFDPTTELSLTKPR